MKSDIKNIQLGEASPRKFESSGRNVGFSENNPISSIRKPTLSSPKRPRKSKQKMSDLYGNNTEFGRSFGEGNYYEESNKKQLEPSQLLPKPQPFMVPDSKPKSYQSTSNQNSLFQLANILQKNNSLMDLKAASPQELSYEDGHGGSKKLFPTTQEPILRPHKIVQLDRALMSKTCKDTVIKAQLEASKRNEQLEQEALQKKRARLTLEELKLKANFLLRIVKAIERFYNSFIFTVFLTSVMILSLFIRDVWVISFNASYDIYSDYILWFVFIFFILESILNSIMFKQYRFSFVFLLDTISTLTILLDIQTLPFFTKNEYKDLKKGVFFNIFAQFGELKLWRATRLFFRKNQTKQFVPINEASMSNIGHTSFHSNIVTQKLQELMGGLTSKKAKARQSKSRRPKTVIAKTDGKKPFSTVDESEMRKLQHQEPTERVEIAEIKDPEEEDLEQDKDEKEENPEDPNRYFDSESDIEEGRVRMEPLSKTPKSQVQRLSTKRNTATNKSVLETFGSDLVNFNKEKDVQKARFRQLKYILNNRLEASGNIRKTINYRNVGIIACTVLMANVGLSIFVSTLYLTQTNDCYFDPNNIQHLLQEDANLRKNNTMNSIFNMYMTKYRNAGEPIIYFQVDNYMNYQSANFSIFRFEETQVCSSFYSYNDLATNSTVSGNISIIIDVKKNYWYTALFNSMRNIFIVVILILNIFLNNIDLKRIAMNPIEKLYEEVTFWSHLRQQSCR